MVLYPNKLPESERVCSGICKWKQDSAVSLFLYLDSVFKNKGSCSLPPNDYSVSSVSLIPVCSIKY